MEIEKFRACPFCGKFEGELMDPHNMYGDKCPYHTNYDYMVRCNECGTLGPQANNKLDAINDWNTRRRA